MPQEHLYGTQIYSGLQQVCCKTVSEGVDAFATDYAGLLFCTIIDLLDS